MSDTLNFLTIKLQCTKKIIVISVIPKGSRFIIPTPPPPPPQKNMLMKKRYMGLWDSNVATFQGIFAIQGWKVCYIDSTSSKY